MPDQDAQLRHTSDAWWTAVRADPDRLARWLLDQYRGESAAAERIAQLRDTWASPGDKAWRILTIIAEQEEKHAAWVAELLAARDVPLTPESKPDRYWPPLLEAIGDLETGCAVGAHAEQMRLARIEAIAADPDGPPDVRACFCRILPEERFHARAFAKLAGAEAIAATAGAHHRGMRALGLVP